MDKHIPKNITKPGYQVVTTFASEDWTHYGAPCQYYGGSWQPGRLEREQVTVLPNAPMRASATLLAERLRTGKHIAYAASLYSASDPLTLRGELRENARARRVKQAKLGSLLGIEIEFYPSPSYDILEGNSLMSIVGDGSLASGGREIRKVTWTDASGRLAGLLRLNIKGTVNKTCGLHVHVDARHLADSETEHGPSETYERMIAFYKHLKFLVPKSRHRNRYCRWMNNCVNSAECKTSDRYTAINYCSYHEHGTIEFRCQGGTIDIVKIESWALLCQWILNFCRFRSNTIPKSWKSFIAALPEPLRSWCILRREKLYGTPLCLDERALSAVND